MTCADFRDSTTLKVTHLHQPAFEGISDVLQSTRIPSRLDYTDIIVKEATRHTEEDDAIITPSTAIPSDFGTVKRQGAVILTGISPTRNATNQSPAIASETGDTQTSNVPRIKSALQGFMLPEMLTQV